MRIITKRDERGRHAKTMTAMRQYLEQQQQQKQDGGNKEKDDTTIRTRKRNNEDKDDNIDNEDNTRITTMHKNTSKHMKTGTAMR